MSTNEHFLNVLPAAKLNAVSQLVSELTRDQLLWTSGFLAGAAANATVGTAPTEGQVDSDGVADKASQTLTILYGSQTGNSKSVADTIKQRMDSLDVTTRVIDMADYKPKKLKDETHLLCIVSTHGEGDPPDTARDFHAFLDSKKAPQCEQLRYAVIGLGDTSYEFFCQTGKDIDARLAKLGAQSMLERLDVDVDIEPEVEAWLPRFIDVIKADLTVHSALEKARNHQTESIASEQEDMKTYTKENPFSASVYRVQKITGRDSTKDIRHVEISLEDSGLTYQPGDSLGVWFYNDVAVVDEILGTLAIDPSAPVTVRGQESSVHHALRALCELTKPYPGFIKKYADAVANGELQAIATDNEQLKAYMQGRQVVDVVTAYPGNISPQQLVECCRPLTPRLYSIASSQAEVEDEVHLTVAHVEYHTHGRQHRGGASGYLANELSEGDQVAVFVEPNPAFKLAPEDKDIIMIGPGTGIAPFRSFLQEREATEASGRNWLFFGNPKFTQDFLYQTELQAYLKSGLLTDISLAFSRDQAEKIYVQHRLLQQAEAVYAWLQSGAYIYVCGDATHMAKDVEHALLQIIQQQGAINEAAAKDYLTQLRREKRYQKDVY